MIDLFQARRESHEARELGHEFKIQEGGVSLEVPRVEGQAFYPSGNAPRMTRDGTPMENIKEGLADLPKAVGSAGAGLAAGAAGLPGDLVGLAGGLAKFMFPGDQGRIEAAAETLSKISETAGSEFFLGLYRDFVNNSDASLEDKQMMLDVAEGASFGSIPGAGVVAKGGVDTIRSGVVKAGEAAQARLDEAAGSTTLASGVDVGKGIDQAIAAAGKAVGNNDMVAAKNALQTREEKGAERVLALAKADPDNKFSNPTIKNVQQYLDEFATQRHGRKLDQYDNPDFNTALKDAAAEIRYQLTQEKSGKGWYDKDIVMTFDMMSQIAGLESMRDNETHRVIWSAIAGATSNNNRVPLNAKIATAQMLRFLRTGKLDETPPAAGAKVEGISGAGFGRNGGSVAKGLKLINFLIDKFGEEGFADWWLSHHTLGEIQALRKEAGFSGGPNGVTGGKDSMHLGSLILGDKTGKFSLNINGLEATTKDVWFTRAYNRYFGTLDDDGPVPYAKEVAQPRSGVERRRMEEFVANLKSQLADLNLTEQDIQAILWYYEQSLYTDLGVRSIPLSFSEGVESLDGQAGSRIRRGDESEITAKPSTTLPGFREPNTKRRTVRQNRREQLERLNSSDGGAGQSGPYTRGSGTDDEAGRVLEPNPNSLARYQEAELHIPRITQVDVSTSQQFHDDMVAAMANHPMGAQVEIKSAKDLSGMQLYRTEGGSGFAIKPDGDVVAVFAGPDEIEGSSYAMLQAAVEMGGKKLDAFRTYLPRIYETVGFRPVSRLKWNDAEAPDGWSKETFKKFNGGEPDVVFFVYDPNYFGDVDYNSLPVFTDYGEALAVQDQALLELGR